MYRNIVLLLEDRETRSNALSVAINMAKTSDGHITGVYVLQMTPTMFSMPDVIDVDALRRKAHKVHEEFDSILKSEGVQGDWHYTEGGDVVAELARQGLYADLIIVSRDHHHTIVDKILITASCPILEIPPSIDSNGSFDRVLVAWKGTREAARALHDALPVLHQASDVAIVMIGESDDEEIKSLTSYLAVHGINAKIEQLPQESLATELDQMDDIEKSISHKLLALSKEENRDLLVMGAFGHSRLSEAILGGVTHVVTRNSEIPVLMSH